MDQSHSPNILLTGGGTLGPVTPLLGLVEAWKQADVNTKFFWIGTPTGPERALVERLRIPFFELDAPKFDRTRFWTWPLIPFKAISSLIKSWNYLEELQPDLVFSAGGYVSVPVIWMAAIKKIPTWIHQLDVEPLLANKLMAPLATKISVTWEQSMKDWPLSKTVLVGGLLREGIRRGSREWFVREKGLDATKPTLLVIGGGTGAQSINSAMENIADELLQEMNVIHLTGVGKMVEILTKKGKGYQVFEMLDVDLPHAYASADLVVARAGMGTITELVALGKPMILLPIPNSGQIANADVLSSIGAAQVLISPTPQILSQAIKHLMRDTTARQKLSMLARRAFQTNAASQIVREAATWVK